MVSTETFRGMFERVVQRGALSSDIAGFDLSQPAPALAAAIAASPAAQAGPAGVIRFYEAAFGRKPDAAGLDYWADRLRIEPGFDTAALAAELAGSSEFAARFAAGGVLDREALVATLYDKVLARAPEPGGVAFWSQGTLSAAGLLHAFATSAEYVARADAPLHAFLADLALSGADDPSGSDADDTRGSIFDPSPSSLDGPQVALRQGGLARLVGDGGGDGADLARALLGEGEVELGSGFSSRAPQLASRDLAIRAADGADTSGLSITMIGEARTLSADSAAGFILIGRNGRPTQEDPLAGADTIIGGRGSDTIEGRGGDDVIDGGGDAGRISFADASPLSLRGLVIGDRLAGGEGADTFRYGAGTGGVDLIRDFDVTRDRLLIVGDGRLEPVLAGFDYGDDGIADTLIAFVDERAGAGAQPLENAAIILIGVTGQSIADLAELKISFEV